MNEPIAQSAATKALINAPISPIVSSLASAAALVLSLASGVIKCIQGRMLACRKNLAMGSLLSVCFLLASSLSKLSTDSGLPLLFC